MKYRHLSLDERQIIENGLHDSKTLKSIGLSLGKDSSTISKEIKRHRIFRPGSRHYSPNNCIYRRECD